MIHSDDNGLVLPPRIARYQVRSFSEILSVSVNMATGFGNKKILHYFYEVSFLDFFQISVLKKLILVKCNELSCATW